MAIGSRTAGRAAAAAVLAGLALLAAGCGGSGGPEVAHVGTTTTGTNGGSSGGSKSGDLAAYSACMRKHGVPSFPDPGKNGELLVKAGPGTGIDPNSARFKAAEKACRKFQPQGGKVNPQLQAKALQQMLAFSRCMRSHGVPKFPDPQTSGGGIQLSIGRDAGVDPNSPQFKAAQKTCQKLMPGPKRGEGGPDGSVTAGTGGTRP